jgi:hypothetical protein
VNNRPSTLNPLTLRLEGDSRILRLAANSRMSLTVNVMSLCLSKSLEFSLSASSAPDFAAPPEEEEDAFDGVPFSLGGVGVPLFRPMKGSRGMCPLTHTMQPAIQGLEIRLYQIGRGVWQ